MPDARLARARATLPEGYQYQPPMRDIMTAQEILQRLTNDPKKGITPERIAKMWRLANASHISRQQMLDAATPDLRAQLEPQP